MKVQETQTRAKKGITRVIFSRIGIIAALLIVQILILVGSVYYLREFLPLIYGLIIVIEAFAIVHLINSPGNPAFKMTWVLLILVFPVVGVLFYLFTKMQPGTYRISNRLAVIHLETRKYLSQDTEAVGEMWENKPANTLLAHYLYKQVGYPTYKNTEVKYFPNGETKFEEMKIRLREAKKFIFLEYFIIAEGLMWDTILDILKKKVAEGVEVRVLYDGMGTLTTLPWHYNRELEACGIKCHVVGKLTPFLSSIQNNRDHRKILVIDGKYGFTGGINLADEYINHINRFGYWKDTAAMFTGEAVNSFTTMFLEMWELTSGVEEKYDKYLLPRQKGWQRSSGYVIPYGDTPFDNENVGEEVYFHIINHAKKYVHIMTPYLILDNEMITTLTRASKSGIEVIIMMPHVPDKWYAYAVAKTYYKELITAGVQIYEFNPGFVHAKIFVSDDDTATVGTVNLDYRGLYLHFECGAFIYDHPEVLRIEDDFQDTLKRCHKVSLIEVDKRNVFRILVGKVLRLLAPLM
ncbi:cardiolipin synthase [Lachnospiraceae bacterium PM6-15]|uniref:cardiolipin synthase n=1 Tax=Ohessyouella blattaphilus TaxID=2949333 RepID=UPI003E1CA2CD